MGFDDVCNTGLVLGLGLGLSFSLTQECNSSPPSKQALDLNNIEKPKKSNSSNFDEPSLTLSLSGHEPTYQEETNFDLYHQSAVSPHDSAVSSFSSGRVKRERDRCDEEVEVEKVNDSSRASCDEDHEDGHGHGPSARKKLRLTKDQSALLEDSFQQNTTLNPKQKQALARKLNLRPRQVEVWFQNRRARKKLKKTEVDCELLKKCYETLTDENKRLQKELQDLKALKFSSQPFYMHTPARMCPSCEIIGGGVGDNNIASKSSFSMAPKSHFFNSFNNPSAAC